MRIATAVFTYDRPEHTRIVLDALFANSRTPDKVFIFQDGLSDSTSETLWSEVNSIIKSFQHKNVDIIISNDNKGLANSITEGVTRVLKEYDAIIVLEDDCVPAYSFIDYMYCCLTKYMNYKQIWQVSGYAWPFVTKEDDNKDIYLCGRMSSWGWGTWKDRWGEFAREQDCLDRINSDPNKSRELYNWGRDLPGMLSDSLSGKVDSWAVYYALQMIDNRSYSLAPYESLIQNIGFDGSGTNCGNCSSEDVKPFDVNDVREYCFPDDIEIMNHIRYCFAESDYGLFTTVPKENDDNGTNKIIVYGAGNYFARNEKRLACDCTIVAFADKGKKGYYAGKKVVDLKTIRRLTDENVSVIIMLADINECLNVARMLNNNAGICSDRIFIGIEKNKFTQNGGMLVTMGGFHCEISSVDEYNNVCEVLKERIYDYSINNDKEDVVIDIGMNVGDASWFFLHALNAKKVYGFEPFRDTYLKAEENLLDYLRDGSRFECFNYGISNVNEEREITYNPSCSCAMSSIPQISSDSIKNYEKAGIANRINNKTETIHVKRATDVFEEIISKHQNDNIVLKMDCEGEEYSIIDDLASSGTLGRVSFIMMEWHYKGNADLLETLTKLGFSYWCCNKSYNMGLIYAFNIGALAKK